MKRLNEPLSVDKSMGTYVSAGSTNKCNFYSYPPVSAANQRGAPPGAPLAVSTPDYLSVFETRSVPDFS